eukprot:scaffold325310_cov32-Prasinocladus_malaysianus.AAC.1
MELKEAAAEGPAELLAASVEARRVLGRKQHEVGVRRNRLLQHASNTAQSSNVICNRYKAVATASPKNAQMDS